MQSIQLGRWLTSALTKSPMFESAIVRVDRLSEQEVLVAPVLAVTGLGRFVWSVDHHLCWPWRIGEGRYGQIKRGGSREALRMVLIRSCIAENM